MRLIDIQFVVVHRSLYFAFSPIERTASVFLNNKLIFFLLKIFLPSIYDQTIKRSAITYVWIVMLINSYQNFKINSLSPLTTKYSLTEIYLHSTKILQEGSCFV